MKNKMKKLWNFFTTYEKIWFTTIVILSIILSFVFPETDDPTYTLTLNKSAYTSSSADTVYTTLDFTGTTGSFVIDGISINGKDYSVEEFTSVKEFTVNSDDERTLTLPLPVPVTSADEISFDGYPDDGGTLAVSITNKTGDVLYNGTSDFVNSTNTSKTTEHPPKYLISAKLVTLLYLIDIFTNVACELLIAKQSKWNFIVSLVVEIVEIAICIVCMYRFATLAVTLLFWIPCDIISFIQWHKNRDSEKEELTIVKKLTPKQDIFVVLGIIVWTVVIGYFLTFIEVSGGIFANNVVYKNIACYMDACVSAVGIANGLFILFRYREQWIAWYISAAIETVINIMAGQWLLLVLKAGYFTNTTYGYIKWTKYISSRSKQKGTEKQTATLNK